MTAVLLTLAMGLAAPVPKDAKLIVPGWGDPVDPLKDCKFDVDKEGKLTMTVPGQGRALCPHSKRMDAPRVLRDVEGSFTLAVTVAGPEPNNTKALVDRLPAFFAAGLYFAEDDQNFASVEMCWMDFKKATCYLSFDIWQAGEKKHHTGIQGNELDPKKPTVMRLSREAGTLRAQFRQGNEDWRTIERQDLKFASQLRAGVAAVNTTDKEFKPVFSDFQLDKTAAKP